jgi:hypothetical protein
MPKAKSPRNGNQIAKNITPITQGITQESKKAAAATNAEDEIRRRAYELFEERGRISGYEHEDWLTAEREITARRSMQTA